MSGHIGRRFGAALWSSASPFFAQASRRPASILSSSSSKGCSIFENAFTHHGLRRSFLLPCQSSRNGIIRSFASGGFLAAGISPTVPVAEATVISCVSTVERGLSLEPRALDRRKVSRFLVTAQKRFTHTGTHRPCFPGGKRHMSSESNGHNAHDVIPAKQSPPGKGTTKETDTAAKGAASTLANKHLMDRLPSLPNLHRPSKEELLAAATGFWSRQKVRFKWFSIRSVRPFNADEIGAFFSWFLLGHVLWIILGTTTFFSLAIFAVNTVFAQGTFAQHLIKSMTKLQQKPWPDGLGTI